MKRIQRIVITAVACFVALFCGSQLSMACTGVYVGSEASADGTAIIARSSDNQAVWGNHITLTERIEKKAGRTMQVDMQGKVFAKLPATTYKYTATPFMTGTMAANDLPNDATACTNEHGVAMTMAITAFSNEAALAADPLVESGLTENTAVDLVICQSRTAREAVKVLLSLVDRYGSSECNIALIADKKEAWYVEMYTGHQYAAVKLPADKVSVFGNEFTMEYLSDFEETITSKNLKQLPKEKHFAVYGGKDAKNGNVRELNLFDTYSGNTVTNDYCHMRTWIGHRVLAPSKYDKDYDIKSRYPLCFTPDHPAGLADVCSVLRNRFEGTKYDPDKTGRIDMRVIGTDTAMSVHALQVFPKLPAEMACVTWESTGPAIYGVFVPVSNAATSISTAYGNDQPAASAGNTAYGNTPYGNSQSAPSGKANSGMNAKGKSANSNSQQAESVGVFDTEHYPYYAFKELSTLCVGPDQYLTYGKPVRDYWLSAEQGMFAGMQKVLTRASKMKNKNAAARYITGYCNEMQEQAFGDAKLLLNDVQWTQSQNSNTMKLGRNPETHEILKSERVLPPMEVNLDASKYKEIPKIQ